MLCVILWHELSSSAFQNLPFSSRCNNFLLCFLVLHYCVFLQSFIKQLPHFIPAERLLFPDEWNSSYVWHEVGRALWILCAWEILEEKKVLLPRRAEKMPGERIFSHWTGYQVTPPSQWVVTACLFPCNLTRSLKAALSWLGSKELQHKINCT